MKFFLALLFCLIARVAFPQNGVWSATTTYPGGPVVDPVEFAIDGKLYVGGGYQASHPQFFQYDPATNHWQSRNYLPWFGGRSYAVCATIGSKAYVGLGFTLDQADSLFWEYDPLQDRWSPLAPFPGRARSGTASFVLGDKLYVVGGQDYYVDKAFAGTYEYDPVTNSWAQKASIPSSGCLFPMSFGIGHFGYVIPRPVGSDTTQTLRYDASNDLWDTVADFPGAGRWLGVGFALGDKGYAGLGESWSVRSVTPHYDMYEYEASSDTWRQLADLPTFWSNEDLGVSVIGDKVYLAGGRCWAGRYLTDQVVSYPNDPAVVSEVKKSLIRAYPNPINGRLTFSTAGRIQVFDTRGCKVMEGAGTDLNVSKLAIGTYHYKFVTTEGVESWGCFVKQ